MVIDQPGPGFVSEYKTKAGSYWKKMQYPSNTGREIETWATSDINIYSET